MENQFWLDKWERQETGFHLSQVHPLLQRFAPEIFEPGKGVFVPLCGKSLDLNYLAAKGDYTLGCELSETAIDTYFQMQKGLPEGIPLLVNESPLQRSETCNGSGAAFIKYRQANLDLLVGDFFALTPAQVAGCTGVYDRAALIALPEAMRRDYVMQLKSLFNQAHLLLVTLEYDQSLMAGPPFSVTETEVKRHFEFAAVDCLYRQNILPKEPRFAERGLDFLNEVAYHIRW